MADTTARVLRLLNLLQSRPVWTGPELSAELGVTTRSIRRDVERLRELGYPVRATQGAGGGYQLGAGKALPPLLLDDDEAVAVVTALEAAASGMDEVAVRTMAKLDQVMPDRLRRKVSDLRSSTAQLPWAADPVPSAELLALSSAIRDGVRVRFDYRSRSGSATQRRVEPYRLVATGRRWYLFAWDPDRDDWRSFRVDRIGGATPTTWRFTRRDSPDPVEYVQRSINQSPYAHVARLRVHAPYDVVAGQVSPSGATLEADGDTTILTAGADELPWFLAFAGALGHDFEILDPPELRAEARRFAEQLLAAARG